MPEITTITSEALQAEVRRLLPSQRGFGQDLEAQNVIVPIVDLTPTAEGSSLRQDLQTAVGVGNLVHINRQVAGQTVVINTPGFFRYQAVLSVMSSGVADQNRAQIRVSDGFGVKVLHQVRNNSDSAPEEPQTVTVEGVFFSRTGDSMDISVFGNDGYIGISAWPIADVYGNLINPLGFTFE